ncbi:MAG: hypothetical protein K9N47_27575 [Prosthecobacter sp.]|uniref:hypothetical protein n=1 Tax=Prosthecobacter sp. TaxID=1965333 RepID=UPI00262474D6|nr:hypothetical protein [Prosthecobacter sp.]MCF7789914.1 hypothetical protein [Prosthecobacter sp.]
MPDDAKKTILSSIPLPGALAVITALAGVMLLNYEPLVPRRPVEPAAPLVVPGDTHRFDAAPGEDPLRAMARARLVPPDVEEFNSASEVRMHQPADFFALLNQRLNQLSGRELRLPVASPTTVLLLPVLLRPGDDVAATEQRSRARTAVAAGLTASGYVPEDVGTLECCRFTPWLIENSSLDVAFEWFRSSPRIPMINYPEHSNVAVLWVRGDALGEQPLGALRMLLKRLLGEGAQEQIEAARLEIAVLGPPSTDNLVAMVKEALNPAAKEVADQWQGPLRMISPWATASAQALLRFAGAERIRSADKAADTRLAEQQLDDLMKQALDPQGRKTSPPFVRSLTTDDYVADALVDELELRGLSMRNSVEELPGSGNVAADGVGHVAIISEYDTSYGRELPLTFIAAAMSGKDLLSRKEDLLLKFNTDKLRWHWINFPRGLDGRFSSATTAFAADKTSSSGKGDSSYAPDEVPLGVSQADALRRLAAQLEELDESLTRSGGAGLMAVGVLGGDVYDKLWILRALRPRLPRTQFFTNNLDAWFWQRDELRTTRNLIVGSPYGIALADKYQMGKLPFRDSYQTSVYAATLAATGAVPPAEFASLRSIDAVRRFEIGRSEPHDLSIDASHIHLHPQVDLSTWWQLPERSHQAWWITVILFTTWLAWMVLSGLPGLGLAFGGKSFTTELKIMLGKVARSPVIIFLLMIGVAWRIESWWSLQRDGGEPLLFASGISAWPAEASRLMAVLLTFYLILKACVMLTDSTQELRARYFADEPQDDSSHGHRSSLDWFKSMFLCWDTGSMLTTRQGEESIVHPLQLWSEYRLSNSITARITRSLVVAVLLYAGASLLQQLLGTTLSPVRGASAREIDLWLDRASLAALLWLTAFVSDMLWLNRVFIQWFSRGTSDWPSEMLRVHQPSDLHVDNLRDFIDLQMVADWTRDIGRLTFFPFYVLTLLILARMDRFDDWNWSAALVVIYFLVVLFIIFGVARVRNSAENLRRKAVAEVHQRYSVLNPDSAATSLLKEIHGLSRGAFVPFSEQPVMKALYWLLGALGVGGLWQAFAQWL